MSNLDCSVARECDAMRCDGRTDGRTGCCSVRKATVDRRVDGRAVRDSREARRCVASRRPTRRPTFRRRPVCRRILRRWRVADGAAHFGHHRPENCFRNSWSLSSPRPPSSRLLFGRRPFSTLGNRPSRGSHSLTTRRRRSARRCLPLRVCRATDPSLPTLPHRRALEQ